jgi:hypothetical protein
MLKLRPNCEYCDKDLPPDAPDAMICTYECTFCRDCVEQHLENVCPNCGGGFAPRPIRPKRSWRPTTGLERHPPSTERVHLKYPPEDLEAFIDQIKAIPPEDR